MQKLGQHFLKDRAVLKKIAQISNPNNSAHTIIEIGPGHGELTTELLIAYPQTNIVAVEKDIALAETLKEKFAPHDNLALIKGDALKLLPNIISDLHNAPYVITGNIPYYITGKLLRTIGELNPLPQQTTILIQEEVAERIVAQAPGMNRLAASVQFWAAPHIVIRVPSTSFSPPPEVESAVITLTTHKDQNIRTQQAFSFYWLVRSVFQQPRKTISNNLLAALKPHGIARETLETRLRQAGIDPAKRPQDLNLEDLLKLSPVFPEINNI